jgi:DNA-directed RNA polymerase specialized sigma24 family protein
MGGRFATTQWSLVLAAGQREPGAGNEALARLCALYWPPVFAFVRRKGYGVAEAEDLTQGFFARLIEKGDLAHADRARGRFRSFLLTACQHHMSHERERAAARKRGGDLPILSIDAADAEERYGRHLAHGETPEAVYERQWCMTLLAGVLDDRRDEYAATGRERTFDGLKRFLGGEDAGYADVSRELGITEGAARVAVHRLRARYRETLRATVAATVATEAEVDDEIEYCLRVLSRR